MTRRRWKGAYVRIQLPDNPRSLPGNIFDLLAETVGYARLRASTVWKMSGYVSDKTFADDVEEFKDMAGENIGLFHLLLSTFYTKIHKEMERRSPTNRFRTRNLYLVAAMSQRELAHVCLTLPEVEACTIPTWNAHAFDIDAETWRTNFVGARAVARVVSVLMHMGADVFFPIAYIDIQWRIDLIAYFPTQRMGLCMQIKNWPSSNKLHYRLVPEEAPEAFTNLPKDDQYFLNGVCSFRASNPGTWLPLRIDIGDASYTHSCVRPPENVLHMFDLMLRDVFSTQEQRSSTSLSLAAC